MHFLLKPKPERKETVNFHKLGSLKFLSILYQRRTRRIFAVICYESRLRSQVSLSGNFAVNPASGFGCLAVPLSIS